MTRREIVIQALQHKETNPAPYQLDIEMEALNKLIAYTGNPGIYHEFGNYLTFRHFNAWPTEMPDRPGCFKDAFGVVWNRSGEDHDTGFVEGIVIEDLEDNDYVFPEIDEARLRAEFEEMMEWKKHTDQFVIQGFIFTIFERAWTLHGMENLLCDMIICPEETEKFFEKIGDYWCRILDIALEYDFDGIFFGDDWGQQKGLIMGIDHWRHYIKPQISRMYKKVKDKGLYVIQHSCGDCHELFPDLIEIGLDVYQTFQPEIYDIGKMKELYGDKLSFWGGISVQQFLPYATPEEVKEGVVKTFNTMRKNGGYIIAPSHGITFDIPPENIMAMVEVLKNQDKYFFQDEKE